MNKKDGYRVLLILPDNEKFGTIRLVPRNTQLLKVENDDGGFELQMLTEKRNKTKTEVLVRFV